MKRHPTSQPYSPVLVLRALVISCIVAGCAAAPSSRFAPGVSPVTANWMRDRHVELETMYKESRARRDPYWARAMDARRSDDPDAPITREIFQFHEQTYRRLESAVDLLRRANGLGTHNYSAVRGNPIDPKDLAFEVQQKAVRLRDEQEQWERQGQSQVRSWQTRFASLRTPKADHLRAELTSAMLMEMTSRQFELTLFDSYLSLVGATSSTSIIAERERLGDSIAQRHRAYRARINSVNPAASTAFLALATIWSIALVADPGSSTDPKVKIREMNERARLDCVRSGGTFLNASDYMIGYCV